MVALALELVAFFGFLCILLNILLPVLAFILRLVVVEVPSAWRKWQLHRYQQRELRRLQRRVDALTRRKLADEQETRRRSRIASARKRQQAEDTAQQTPNGHHPIADFVPGTGPRTNGERKSSSKHKSTSASQQHRHRLSINSTAKKPAVRERRRTSVRPCGNDADRVVFYEQEPRRPLEKRGARKVATQFHFGVGKKMAASSCSAVLVLVCGLPAAGKTTLVKQLIARGSTPSRVYERISFDDLFEQALVRGADGDFDPDKWKTCQQEMVVRVSTSLKQRGDPSLAKNKTQQLVLVVDDNFQYRSLRKRFFHVATELHCGFAILYLGTPPETCRERNAARSGRDRVPDEVFERMAEAFEAPKQSQNASEANAFELNGVIDDASIEEAMDALVLRAGQDVNDRRVLQMEQDKMKKQQRRDRVATQQDILHRLDLQLRRWVSAQLQDESTLPSGMTKAKLAVQLNQRRKDYIASMKKTPGDIADVAQGEAMEQVVVSLVLRFQQQQE